MASNERPHLWRKPNSIQLTALLALRGCAEAMRGLQQHSEGFLSPDCRAKRGKQQSSAKAATIRFCLLSQDSLGVCSCGCGLQSQISSDCASCDFFHVSTLQSAAASLCKNTVSGEVYEATVRQQQCYVSSCAEGTAILATCTSQDLP